MPTYEYACDACKNEWEAEQRISEDHLKVCPKCGEPKAKRLISGGSFMLKGGGWYKDLYSSSKPASKSSTDSSSSGSSGSDSSSSSSAPSAAPSTPAAKSESTSSSSSAPKSGGESKSG